MDSLLILVCQSSSPTAGGDAPDDESAIVIIEDGPLCDGAEIVVNITSVARVRKQLFLSTHLVLQQIKYC